MPVWLVGIVSHWGTKAVGILLVLAILIGGPYLWGRRQYNQGYQTGYAKAVLDNPRNVYNGPTKVIQKACSDPTGFGFLIGSWLLGVGHLK